MRLLSKVLLAVCLLVTAASLPAQDNETVNTSTTMNINDLGDGVITIQTTFTAVQFRMWKNQYGDDQGLLKRDMTKDWLGKFDLGDWDIKIDSTNRAISVSVKVHGVVVSRGGGTFGFGVPKSWRGGERVGTTYSYNFAQGGGGTLIQNSVKLIFPADASRFSEDKSETGDTIIQYHVPTGGMTGMLLYAGAGLLVLGLLAIVLALAIFKPARRVTA